MKAWDIARKDMLQSFRNRGALVFMFVIPVLITVLFAFMFGGIADAEEGFTLPQTAVLLVDRDEGQLPPQMGMPPDLPPADSMGGLLSGMLRSEELAELVSVTVMDDAATARTAVDNQEADVAVIIPPDFTAALMEGGEGAETAMVELYADPTLTIGPALVESIVRQFVDGFAAANISVGVTLEQMAAAGVPITPELVQEVVARAGEGASAAAQSGGLVTTAPPPGQAEEAGALTQILSLILGGMMVFYAFFTGANVLHSILTEEEIGTLQRLFTTPTTHMAIFSGKFLAALLVLTVQVTVLLLFGWLVFDINWGRPLPLLLAAVGLVIIAATSGLFLVSLLKDTRQAGVIFGGLLTLTGMLGLFPVFAAGSPALPPVLNTVALLVPQGWAIRGLRQAMDGRSLGEILLTLGAILLWSGVLFAIGQRRLQKRFA